MKKTLVSVAVIAVLVLSYWYLRRPEAVPVSLADVEKGYVENTVANTRAGTVEACQRAKLSVTIGGQIDQLLVDEGDHVKQGQVMLVLWNKDRRARLEEAEAAVLVATRERESQCISARSDLREARRLTGLVSKKLVSAETADLAESKAQASAARCESAKAREVQSKAAVAMAEAVLEQTRLQAPFDGVVADVTGELGEYVTPSPPGIPTPPAIDLITDDCHYIAAPIDEVDAADIAVGLPVRVTLDAFRDRSFEATVSRISPYVEDYEKQARTVEVEARLEPLPDDVRLLTGYSADMEIILNSRDDAVRVPSEVIIDNQFVLVVNEDGYLEKRAVTRGLSNWRYTEITEGLAVGEQVVANVGAGGVVAGARAAPKSDKD
ncbi:MAG: efflux transporter periplasmic adaptor subunit [Porticoccaceae bacterium]|nr:efflux transporter periplasmic adaptor subunit [Porticoccaceae bacterium]